jgi:hypothetical protein
MSYRTKDESGKWGPWRPHFDDHKAKLEVHHYTSPVKLVAHQTLGMTIRTFEHRQGSWTWEVIQFGGSMVQFRFNTSPRDALAETILAKQFEKNEKDKNYESKRSK